MKVFVVDRDYRRRADLAYRLSTRGIYAAPYDPDDPFTAPRGELALLVCHDPPEDREAALAFLQRFGAASLLVFYSEAVILPHIVTAMQRGALSYFRWPDDADELIELIGWTVTTAAAGIADPAAARIVPPPMPAGWAGRSSLSDSQPAAEDTAAPPKAAPKTQASVPDPVRLGMVTRKADAKARLGALSRRELEILRLVANGHSSNQIGDLLGISRRTVESHRSSILNKTQSHSTAHVLRWAIEGEII